MTHFTQELVSTRRPANLAVWITSMVAIFVLLGSLVLVWTFERRIEREERHAFEELARVNASFLERSRLPLTAVMATQLGEIIGAKVFFWQPMTGTFVGKPGNFLPQRTLQIQFNGKIHTIDRKWIIGRPARNGTQVIFTKPATPIAYAVRHVDTWTALVSFWLLSLSMGWFFSRKVASPLRNLSKSLPLIGTEHELPDLPVSRQDEIGQLARTLALTHISLQQEREKRRAAERHALLGQMATSLAHEVRNPVSAIRLHAQLLENASPEEASVSRQLIESEAERIEELVGQWLSHTKPPPPILGEVNIHDLILNAVRIIEPQARHAGVKITVLPRVTAPLTIHADRHRLQQIFGNLLRNAIQSMATGGNVTVRIIDADFRVTVSVEDEGPGFSKAALDHLGEPFYSEKEGGMGLGLAVVQDICMAHDGNLFAENRAAGGATVRVEFAKNPSVSHSPIPSIL